MDFRGVATDTSKQMQDVVNYILTLEISPDEKILRLQRAFHIVGEEFYMQLFNAVSEVFDSTMITSLGLYADDQISNLSVKLVRNYGLGRQINPIVIEFYDSVLGKAQSDAFSNAKSLRRHPTLTRRLVGETCKWCTARARTFVNPQGEDFARHENCDCLFIVKGFNSRNGILTNYKKGK